MDLDRLVIFSGGMATDAILVIRDVFVFVFYIGRGMFVASIAGIRGKGAFMAGLTGCATPVASWKGMWTVVTGWCPCRCGVA